MRRRRYLMAIVVAAAACSAEDPRTFEESTGSPAVEPAVVDSQPHHHDLDVDWVQFGHAELYRSAQAIVRGRVITQRPAQHRSYPYDPARERTLTADEAGEDYAELPLTISVIEVHERLYARGEARALRDQAIDSGSQVEVVQLGGRYEHGCAVVPNDQPLLSQGEDVVLYLKQGMVPHEVTNPIGIYSIIGGQQGLVPLRDGVAAPIGGTVFERYAGQPVSELAREIRQVASDVQSGRAPSFLEEQSAAACDISAVELEPE